MLHAVSAVFGKTIRSSDASDHVARGRGPDSAVHGHRAVRPGPDPGGRHRTVPDRFRRARRAGVRVLFHGWRDKGRHRHGFVSGDTITIVITTKIRYSNVVTVLFCKSYQRYPLRGAPFQILCGPH